MKKAVGALPLIMTLIVSLISLSCTAWGAVAQTSDSLGAPETAAASAGYVPLKQLLASDSAGPAVSSSSAESIEVSASASDALGKVYEQFISPYSAGLSYNNIYLKNSTGIPVSIKEELEAGLSLTIEDTDEPQVLIVHTHTTESYMTEDRDYYTAADASRSTDDSKNMVAVGERLARVLREGGVGVIHDTTQHDHPAYNGSYSRAAVTINEYLKQYPSIKIVVDVHRDSIAVGENDKAKPTVTVDGKKAAQVMLVMGSETGSITDFPCWRENLRLALRFQQTMEVLYPGLARPLLLASRKYNENLTTGSMILEVGTDSNTLEEACYSAELAGNALLSLLNTLK